MECRDCGSDMSADRTCRSCRALVLNRWAMAGVGVAFLMVLTCYFPQIFGPMIGAAGATLALAFNRESAS